MDVKNEKFDSKEDTSATENTGMGKSGKSAVQGKNPRDQDSSHKDLDQTTKKLEYRVGSPHKDYELYKSIKEAQRRHELGQRASRAKNLPDVIDTTLAAKKGADSSDETPMEQYFREKYGPHPYTTDAYPPDEDK
jgi:hypothetical protein